MVPCPAPHCCSLLLGAPCKDPPLAPTEPPASCSPSLPAGILFIPTLLSPPSPFPLPSLLQQQAPALLCQLFATSSSSSLRALFLPSSFVPFKCEVGSSCTLWASAQNPQQKVFMNQFSFSSGFIVAVPSPQAQLGLNGVPSSPRHCPRSGFPTLTLLKTHRFQFACLLGFFQLHSLPLRARVGFLNCAPSPLAAGSCSAGLIHPSAPTALLLIPFCLPALLDSGIGEPCWEGPSSAPDVCFGAYSEDSAASCFSLAQRCGRGWQQWFLSTLRHKISALPTEHPCLWLQVLWKALTGRTAQLRHSKYLPKPQLWCRWLELSQISPGRHRHGHMPAW